MALALTQEHRALADSVRGWAGRTAPPSVTRAAAEAADHGADHYRGTLRAALADQGLLGLHLPEPVAGQGYGIPELAIALEELGRALVPGVFLPTVLASAVLARALAADTAAGRTPAGSLESVIKDLAQGTLTGAAGLGPGMSGDPGAHAGTLVIGGSCGPVLGGGAADVLVLPVSTAGGRTWVVVDAADLDVTPVDGLDLTRPAARVRAEDVAVPADRVLSRIPAEEVMTLAATLFGAEASGIAGWAVDTAAAYAAIRHQFGRPIGQFQAVKHRCARMLTLAEQAAAAVWDAARAQGEAARAAAETGRTAGAGSPDGADADLAACAAAVVAVDAAVTCVHECIQVLGGIGYTWEHDAHLYYRRALSLRAVLGRTGGWAARAARLALDGARRPPGVELPAEAEPVRDQVRRDLAAVAAAGPAQRPALLADGGWVAPHLPRPWGRDAGPLEQLVISDEMRSAGLRPPVLMIGAWVVPALVQYGSAQQQRRFLPPTLRGEIVWCQLFSEPGAGSDLAGLSTKAVRAEGGWSITGQKVWTSLAKEAAWAICLARTDPAQPRHAGISYFLLDMTSPGVRVRPLREMSGDALFNEVFLEEVFVPDELVVGEVNDGWRVARTTLANERVSLSQNWTFGCGASELLGAVRDAAADQDAAMLERAGQLVCEGHAIDMLGTRAALKRLSGTDPGATGSVRKVLGMRHAQQVAEECWTLTGAEGALAAEHWSRAVLFTRALTIGGGTTDIQLNIIAERMLGLPRDPDPPA